MADRIVEVEEIMADMATSCCRGSNNVDKKGVTPIKNIYVSNIKSRYGDDDEVLSHCNFNETKSNSKSTTPESNKKNIQLIISKSRDLIIKTNKNFQSSLTTNQIKFLTSQPSFLRSNFIKSNEIMPCQTFWNPFCCAAEVCADMIVEMIELMASGADWMTEMCKSMIDEIGRMADGIVETEENIILMGYNIGYMADCIVVFIDQSAEFMTLFCPNQDYYYSLKGDIKMIANQQIIKEEGCSSLTNKKYLELKDVIIAYSPDTIFVKQPSTLFNKYQELTQFTLQLKEWINNYNHNNNNNNDILKSNPFGEFAQMVDVMMETMSIFMKIMDQQTALINDMMNSISTLSKEEVKLSTMVVDMSEDVIQLEDEINTQEDMMIQLTNC